MSTYQNRCTSDLGQWGREEVEARVLRAALLYGEAQRLREATAYHPNRYHPSRRERGWGRGWHQVIERLSRREEAFYSAALEYADYVRDERSSDQQGQREGSQHA